MVDDCVKVGDWIVIQRQNYTKLHKISTKESVMLGKDQIELSAVVGNPVWTTYKMTPKKNAKRAFSLEECNSSESLVDQLIKDVSSGSDNRNIFDDGRSQLLSTEEIISLRSSGLSGQAIVGQLIENSKTFRDKTEYSQEKYLKKKEKKYFEYVTIKRPTIRLIAEILYRTDPTKILGLRMDSLSQILTAVGLQPQGTYVVYESGCQALVVAAMLNNTGEGGHIVHVHPGNFPQKNAVSAMNFSPEQLERLVQVNVQSLLKKLLQENGVTCQEEAEDVAMSNNKRKIPFQDEPESKRPRWEVDTTRAADLVRPSQVDGLVVVAREHPANIVNTLLPYVAPSRPFVVFSPCREPLLELYVQLKCRSNAVSLRVTETWLRTHQILPSRTHPDILMSGGGGYLLTGIVVTS